jgi:hypothetical protein
MSGAYAQILRWLYCTWFVLIYKRFLPRPEIHAEYRPGFQKPKLGSSPAADSGAGLQQTDGSAQRRQRR